MDQVDIADQVITEFLEKSILAARGIPRKTVSQSAKACIVCNDEIPELRRIAVPGCQRCVSCEEDHECYGKRTKEDKHTWDEDQPIDEIIDDIYIKNI